MDRMLEKAKQQRQAAERQAKAKDSAITTSLSRSAFGCPNDIRSFIALLEQAGELRRVTTEVDWRYEAGAMSRLVTERRGPAPLFERVKDYPDQRIAAVLFGPSKPNLHSRVALALTKGYADFSSQLKTDTADHLTIQPIVSNGKP
jgi:hypothetical protein